MELTTREKDTMSTYEELFEKVAAYKAAAQRHEVGKKRAVSAQETANTLLHQRMNAILDFYEAYDTDLANVFGRLGLSFKKEGKIRLKVSGSKPCIEYFSAHATEAETLADTALVKRAQARIDILRTESGYEAKAKYGWKDFLLANGITDSKYMLKNLLSLAKSYRDEKLPATASHGVLEALMTVPKDERRILLDAGIEPAAARKACAKFQKGETLTAADAVAPMPEAWTQDRHLAMVCGSLTAKIVKFSLTRKEVDRLVDRAFVEARQQLAA